MNVEAQRIRLLVAELEKWIPNRQKHGYSVQPLQDAVRLLNDYRAQLTKSAWDGTVVLQYFRAGGRYYSEGSYQTAFTEPMDFYKIHDEVRRKLALGNYPGLSGSCPYFHVLVLVPGHPYEFPLLIPATKQE